MLEINKYKVTIHLSIRNAVKQIDEGGIGFCVCVDDEDKVIGVISDGDFRRAVLNGVPLNENVDKIINRNFKYLLKNYTKKDVKDIFTDTVAQHIPVLDDGKLIDIITERSFFGIERKKNKRVLNNHVVIMAGGKGNRLDPFTRILPKPLIPIGNDPVIKVIMDKFRKFGMNDFYISLNEKGRMVKAYFHDHDLGYRIEYIEEDKPLGTAGALKCLDGKMDGPFFVSNCDIIIHADYVSIFDFHKKGGYDLTLVGSMQQYTIPYGICDIDRGGVLKGIREKPEYDFLVNTGLYLLKQAILQYIPENEYFDMTDLIKKIQDNGLKVGVFPVSEKAWINVGQWRDYKKMMNELSPD
jgi:dTDP-glucose pyrophosphorylase